MNSFFARIKRKFNNTFFARYLHRRFVNNNNNIYNNLFTGIMAAPNTNDIDTDTDTETDTDTAIDVHIPEPDPEPETIHTEVDNSIFDPKTQVKYFSTILNKRDIEFDYSLFDIKRIITEHKIKIEDITLDHVFESEIDICDDGDVGERMTEKNHDIFKTKMRLFYVIIANNLHDKLFNRKKAYTTTSSATHSVGVFQYDNYIIRIDDSPHCFESEKEVIKKIGNSESGVVLPFFTHINIPEKKTPESIAETGAGEETVPLLNKQNQTDHKTPSLFTFDESSRISYSDHLKNTFKKYNISFSVQPYIKNTESLLYWVKANITDHHNLNLTHVRKTFIIPLFYKCACLIEPLHLHDIVHGDIKPDNILIEQTDKFHLTSDNCSRHFSVYLIDYGLSGKANISIGTGGTTPYCHPEFRNIRDSKDTENYRWGKIQKKHDVWSLGLAFLTLYVYGKFNSYYHKFPSYFFEKNGYIADMVIDTIADIRIRSLFRDMMTGVCISITEVKVQLHSILLL